MATQGYMAVKLSCLLMIFASAGEVSSEHDYALAQHLSTYFLGAQRCGDTQSWIHPSGGCHLTDGEAVGRDLTGGWHDCGDYIKFHVTGPYAAFTFLYGYFNYPEAYPDNYSQAYSAPPPNGIPDILDEVKIQTDYLIKGVHNGTAYWQVGDGRDHNSFSDPITNSFQQLYDESNIRAVYSTTSGRSNALGDAAAALALMSVVYREFDEDYADECLEAAKQYYDIARINPFGTGNARDSHYDWMEGIEWEDNVGLAAAMLYRATGDEGYLNQAISYAYGISTGVHFSYGRMNHILFLELYSITSDPRWLHPVSSRVSGYSVDWCGYWHNVNWGSLRNASNAAMLAALYHMHTGNRSAYEFAKRNVDFILGSHDGFANVDSNFSFLIGYNELGGGYPRHPHHAAAFGKGGDAWSLYREERSNPGSVNYEYELTGGLAGGPESLCGNFYDNIDNYVSSEYCIYYNAAFTSAVAYINKIENNIPSIPLDTSYYAVPGLVQAQDFASRLGIQTEPAQDDGGGVNIAYIDDGNWAEYLIDIEASGIYDVYVRVATDSEGGVIRFIIDGEEVGGVTVENTGGWQEWQTVSTELKLSRGRHILRTLFTGTGNGSGTGLYNINWFDFEFADYNQLIEGRGISKAHLTPSVSLESMKHFPHVLISSANAGRVELQIVTASGRVVETYRRDIGTSEQLKIPLGASNTELSSGVYFLRYNTPDLQGMKRIYMVR
ncbi:endoglucanase [Chitinispirillum alkaliphilum]|nr:endoglucanase [Chitinispirillum alkaliphilum]